MAAEGLVDDFLLEDHQGPRPANASPPGGEQGPRRACAAAVGCRGGSDGWAKADPEVWWWTGLASQVAAYVTEESLGQAGDQCREAHRALRDSAHRLVSQRRTIAQQQQQQHRTVRGRSKRPCSACQARASHTPLTFRLSTPQDHTDSEGRRSRRDNDRERFRDEDTSPLEVSTGLSQVGGRSAVGMRSSVTVTHRICRC